jgi:tetratricopeptide (TPR) repeat protein
MLGASVAASSSGLRVYLSSTFEDLTEYRSAALVAVRRLKHIAVGMEEYVAGPRPPLETCLDDVSKCDLYVLLLAWRYGYIPENHEESITELEYRKAIECGIPTLIFLLDEHVPWLPKFVDGGSSRERLLGLRKEVEIRAVISYFTGPTDLQAKLTAALALHVEVNASHERQNQIEEARNRTGCLVVGLNFADAYESFRDRTEEQRRFRDLFEDPRTKFICVVGRPGIGKTSLLATFCSQLERRESRDSSGKVPEIKGVVYVTCRTGLTLYELISHLILLLGDAPDTEVLRGLHDPACPLRFRIEAVLGKLREGTYVLALDQIENILSSEDAIADPELREFFDISLSTRHGLRILASSRRRIVLSPSSTKAVRFLNLDVGLPEGDGVLMLRDFDADGQIGLRDAEEEELRAAVHACHGIPRAIEALAGMLACDLTLSLRRLLADPVLFSGSVVENLIAEQYRRLSFDQLRVLDTLSVFKRPVAEVAAKYVLAALEPRIDVHACLATLVRGMCVTYRRDTEVYGLHPLDQEYVYARIPQNGPDYTRQMLHHRAAGYFESQPSSPYPADIKDLEPRLEARAHYFQAGEFEAAAGLASESTRALLRLGQYGIVDRIFDETLRTATGYALATAHLGMASIAGLKNDWMAAVRHNRRVAEILEPSEVPREIQLVGVATVNTGYAFCHVPDFSAAKEACRQALRIAEKQKDNRLEMKSLSIQMLICLSTGNNHEVLEIGARCLELEGWSSAFSDASTAPTHVVDMIGLARLALGDTAGALIDFEKSLAMRKQLNTKFGLGHSYHNMGITHNAMGNFTQATQLLHTSLSIREEIGHQEGVVETLCALGNVYAERGQIEEALQTSGRALTLALERGDGGSVVVARARLARGTILVAAQRWADAKTEIVAARQIAADTGLIPELAKAEFHLAVITMQSGQTDVAREFAQHARELSKVECPPMLNSCESLLARLMSQAA